MYKHVFLLLSLISALHAAQMPSQKKVIFLKGVTCSGKTTTCQALSSSDKNWKMVSEDDIWTAAETEQMQTFYPQSFADIASAIAYDDIFHAVRYNFLNFSTQDPQKKAACLVALVQLRADAGQNKDAYWSSTKPLITQRFLAAVGNELEKGSNVIVDSWHFDPPALEVLNKKPKCYTFSTYANLPTLVSRLKIRNEASRKSNCWKQVRKLHHVVGGFRGLYSLISHPPANAVIYSPLNHCTIASIRWEK